MPAFCLHDRLQGMCLRCPADIRIGLTMCLINFGKKEKKKPLMNEMNACSYGPMKAHEMCLAQLFKFCVLMNFFLSLK